MKTKLFEKILRTVSEVTEVPDVEIISKSRTCDVIEARTLLIYYCVKHGLSVEFLKRKLNLSSVGIKYPLRMFYDREKLSYSFREMSNDICTKLK